ncbi:lysis inhibition; accessory protein [Acinetobacter phage vB_AbaM_Konradin]|uniref:RIII lysis inhibition accessory protein n=10 Tax=Lazarusvirus TaxID=2842820 RepID=A0A650EY46_9CAUD|nr:lysis inhibition; accessory protein [Acinetobacter phage vB_ApiM_fHyAci03]YP_009881494.1 lysis inhibition; accessory protein [Acinetobacter phage KARL-1]YP_009885391.1 lysis inhibition; accessory protein [Acinetobacter phage vB_AbaM_Konradin]YP_009886235.1 lysis inhibition; accessory protein [Acinetobacter phage vB_AbaM_Berthold]YP_009886481.1 lysis inhibition; accessory protein [Acinetobacter phage vB_AbaM_Apostate]YP_009886731.1 lysis inhibition; accessory protein [Acinetobacter phage vB_
MDIRKILMIQREAWNKGHENYGTELDILGAAKAILDRFNHLNPAQKRLLESINQIDSIKYAKPLCSRANKEVRRLVVTLK